MARGVNKVFLLGTLGDEPALRTTARGVPYAFLTLKTSEDKDPRFPDQPPVQWHKIVLWNQLAQAASRVLHKGHLIYLEGKVRTAAYVDEDRAKRFSTQIEADFIVPLEDDKAAASLDEAAVSHFKRRAVKGLPSGNEEGLLSNLRGEYVKGDPFSASG